MKFSASLLPEVQLHRPSHQGYPGADFSAGWPIREILALSGCGTEEKNPPPASCCKIQDFSHLVRLLHNSLLLFVSCLLQAAGRGLTTPVPLSSSNELDLPLSLTYTDAGTRWEYVDVTESFSRATLRC